MSLRREKVSYEAGITPNLQTYANKRKRKIVWLFLIEFAGLKNKKTKRRTKKHGSSWNVQLPQKFG